ncbi:MAG: nucleoside kinase [Spirochaetaceae bacterium]|nr:nucleoside kinase [Spirochaetaceae bacterium]
MRKVNINLEDKETVSVIIGTEFSVFEEHFASYLHPIAAFRVNNEIMPFSAPAQTSARLEAVPLFSESGAVVHRRTLSFVLCAAVSKVCPKRLLRVGHSLGSAYYFSFADGVPPDAALLKSIKDCIDSFIAEKANIEKILAPFNEALEYFNAEGREETARLLRQTGSASIELNAMGSYRSIYVSALLPNAGLIQAYELIPYSDGFLLRFPVLETANGKRADSCGKSKEFLPGSRFIIPAFTDMPGIFGVFCEAKRWARIAGVHLASQLNSLVARREIKEFIWIAEAFADKRLSEIANAIAARKNEVKLVLIAGPSSSGKTTTAKRLSIQLKTVGLMPLSISLDDYYLHPDLVPHDEKGNPDFECLESLDVAFLNEQLCALLAGKEITLPSYDFKSCTRREGKKMRLEEGNLLLVEGIHGLNDALTPAVPRAEKFKLYASALICLNLDDHNRIATTDNRLLRRLVRDNQFRGIGAERTLKMWPDVQRGAEEYIFKFQNGADAVFNTALDYEMAVLKLYAEPLLRSVHPESVEFSEASRLLSLLGRFTAIPSETVPPLSVLREFIGGSGFKY